MPAVKAMIKAYQQGYAEKIDQLPKKVETQAPDTMIVTCCDSRIELGQLFGVSPGELFVVRNVANIIPLPENDGSSHGVSAALEFAVKFLKVKNIIVMGHSNCGGIRALCESQKPTEYIASWVKHVVEAKESIENEGLHGEDLFTALEKRNVVLGVERLMKFAWINEAVHEGSLKIYGWHFDLGTYRLEPVAGSPCPDLQN